MVRVRGRVTVRVKAWSRVRARVVRARVRARVVRVRARVVRVKGQSGGC